MTPLLTLRGVVKEYRALRPLRVAELEVGAGECVVLEGLDAPAAELFVALVTAATLPDAGEVSLFGQSTGAIDDHAAWLSLLDGLGVLTERAVLLESLSVRQNAALPFTLAVDPIPEDVRPGVDAVLRESGLPDDVWDRPVGAAGPDAQARVRLARAVALGPRLMLAEHPSASLPRETVARFGADLAAVARARGASLIVLTADDACARAVGGRRLVHDAKTGAFRRAGLLSRWF